MTELYDRAIAQLHQALEDLREYANQERLRSTATAQVAHTAARGLEGAELAIRELRELSQAATVES